MKIAHRATLHSVSVAAIVVGLGLFAADRQVTTRLQASPVVGETARPSITPLIRRDLILVSIGVLLIGVVLSRVFARRLAGPVEELRDVAKAVAAGDLLKRPGLDGDNEITELADALRALSSQLQVRRVAFEAEQSQVTALTESLHEGVIAIDAKRQIVRINQTARQLLRLREPVPFSADQLPRDRTLLEALQAVFAGTESVPGQVQVEDRTLSLAARPLPNGGAVLAFYDLTAFRRLESVRRDFVANVSHELRTPLTVVRGVVETLQDDDIAIEMRRHFLGMADRNVQRMQRIVDDLLDLSRIESGGWLPDPVRQSFNAVASEIVANLAEVAHTKGVTIRIEADAGVPNLYADPTAVRQILSNLAENALRHTMHGEVVLYSSADEHGVWIGVRDTGIGMDAVHLPRIFERFYRADPSRSREVGGTGLGLAIVRHLTEAHGGTVQAESKLGVGTTIAAYFPNANSAAA